MRAVIPPRRNRKVAREHDRDLCKERDQIERFVNKLKQFRRAATRYDKLLANQYHRPKMLTHRADEPSQIFETKTKA